MATELTEQDYLDYLKSETNIRANTPLNNNPNILYKDILSPEDIQKLAIVRNDAIYNYFNENYDNTLQQDYDENIAPKLKSYDRAPIDYEARLGPNYANAKAVAEKENAELEAERNAIIMSGTQKDLEMFDITNNAPTENNIYLQTLKPYNLDRRIEIANLGYDPDLSIDEFLGNADIPNNPFTGKFALQTDLTLNPRELTKKQWEYLARRHGLNGELRYMRPGDPKSGVVYQPKGSNEWYQMDTPEMEFGDAVRGVVTELPSLAGDILLGFKGAKKLEPILKKIDDINLDFTSGPVQRFLQIGGVSTAAGTGAFLGEFARLAAGAGTGANNITFEQALKDSGTLGLMAIGGTALVGVGLQLLPALWKVFTKGRIPPEVLRQIREDLTAAQASRVDGQLPDRDVNVFGSPLSEKEVVESVEEMVGETVAQGWKPTVGQITGEQRMIDLENAFIKGAGSSQVKANYIREVVAGNDRVIMAYAKALADGSRDDVVDIVRGTITKRREGVSLTGAELEREIMKEVEKEILRIEDDAIKVLSGLGDKFDSALPPTNVGVNIAGGSLFDEVPAPDISAVGQRSRTRLEQGVIDYMKPFNEAVDDRVAKSPIGETLTGSGKLRKPTEAWMNARDKATDDLFVNPEADEAVDLFYRILGTKEDETLFRLLGREPVRKTITKTVKRKGKEVTETQEVLSQGRFKSGNFSFDELERARISMNDIASSMIGKNKTVVKYARDLERGLEAQQHQLIRTAAENELYAQGNKKVTKGMIDKFVHHPIDNPTGEFGKEIYESWIARNRAFDRVHADSIAVLAQQDRNGVVEYLLQGNKPGSPSNPRVAEIMYLLKTQSGEGQVLRGAIPEIRKGLVERVKFILDNAELTPLQRAKEYNQFMRRHKGTFNEVFGESGYNARFGSAVQFRKTVINPLEQYEQGIADIRAKFGTALDPTNSGVTNPVQLIVNASRNDITEGTTLKNAQELLKIVRNNPVLKEEIASGIREAMSEKIVTRLAGRTGSAPDAKAIASLFDGYSIKGAGNEANTFENVVVPLLGKNGKKYVKNLRVLDEMLQRELAQATPGSVAAYKELTDPGIAWWKRMIIKPLTQLGRRVTAIERTAGTKAEKSLGLILQNEKLLDATIKAVENEATRRTYYKVLTSWALGTGRGDDISVLPFSDYWAEAGSDFTNYDKVNKQRKDVENRTKIDDKRQSTYMRLLETSDFFDRLAQAGIN